MRLAFSYVGKLVRAQARLLAVNFDFQIAIYNKITPVTFAIDGRAVIPLNIHESETERNCVIFGEVMFYASS